MCVIYNWYKHIYIVYIYIYIYRLPRWRSSKESACQSKARDSGSIPEMERSPGVGNGNLLQYSCLENSTDRGGWQAIVHGVTKLDMTEQIYTHMCIYYYTHMCITSGILRSYLYTHMCVYTHVYIQIYTHMYI